MLTTPACYTPVDGDLPWAADNGCFAGFDAASFRRMLARLPTTGLFVVCPDVVGNHTATLELWPVWSTEIAKHGHRPAFVLQDGCGFVPEDAGAIFVGGSTEFKLSRGAARLVADAKRQGLWVHMGRVNSRKRLFYASQIGCDSIDGTSMSRFPKTYIPKMLRWAEEADQQPRLFRWGDIC